MVRPEEHWETARLRARPAAVVDAQELFDGYAADPEVARYMIWRPHRDAGETVAFLRRCETAWDEGSAFPWTLWTKDGTGFAGMLEARVHGHSIDVGYALCRRLWRQGLMSEALGSFVRWAIAQPEIYRVWATCDVENVASARLLERVGMQQEGVLRRWIVHPNVSDVPRDALCYSIVKTDAS
jgi:ribosomal-protein-alanine N-acetyltransferase